MSSDAPIIHWLPATKQKQAPEFVCLADDCIPPTNLPPLPKGTTETDTAHTDLVLTFQSWATVPTIKDQS